MNDAHRVVVRESGPALEDDAAGVGLDQGEVERARDRRCGQIAGKHRPEHLEAGLARHLVGASDAELGRRRAPLGVDGLPFAQWVGGCVRCCHVLIRDVSASMGQVAAAAVAGAVGRAVARIASTDTAATRHIAPAVKRAGL